MWSGKEGRGVCGVGRRVIIAVMPIELLVSL